MSLFKKSSSSSEPQDKRAASIRKPHIETVFPGAAISGGEIVVRGSDFVEDGLTRPAVRFGDHSADLIVGSSTGLVVRVPEGATNGEFMVCNGTVASDPAAIKLGVAVAENLHPVASPAVDAAGNIFTTMSGTRGQKVPVSVFKIDPQHQVLPFISDLMNPTGLAIDREGKLYISSRMEGTIYQATADGLRSVYAEGMGVATGIAFDQEENLYVGDRTGTIFKIDRARQIFVFATLEPSIAAYHLAFGPDHNLYVTGPTTSSYDHVYRITPAGEATMFYRGLGRPQGLAFDAEGNLYVAASLAGRRGVVRLTPKAQAELVVAGFGIVGLAFTQNRSMVLATNSSVFELPIDIEGLPLLR
jgi:sugar lactone lactonase YvrE